ncbi:muscle M-line assembly protein unc-89-like [Pollicipes pollicipes]|uniref:muscle M-line assembly protein unc-89-like n=1 Tax=Pollicipes pollicipes TaxID=41117 RepID=UPI0018853F9F|nr:muscle M-line assembly protein unc-89-like [Pollicipes pollicipes]
MGTAESTAELTLADIENQLTEEERCKVCQGQLPPRFTQGLLPETVVSIADRHRFTIEVASYPEPDVAWFREEEPVQTSEMVTLSRGAPGKYHLDLKTVQLEDQGEWRCVATNPVGQAVTTGRLTVNRPRHYKAPYFLEPLRASLTETGTVNLQCKVVGTPQPALKWYKDGHELKAGDIHRITSGGDGTCCLGNYTCEAFNCMGSATSSAALLGLEEMKRLTRDHGPPAAPVMPPHEPFGVVRNPSLSTINEERTSQMMSLFGTPQGTDTYLTPMLDGSVVSVVVDGREVSASVFGTGEISLQQVHDILEAYSEHLSEGAVSPAASGGGATDAAEVPSLRVLAAQATSGNVQLGATVIDVSLLPADQVPPAPAEEDARTEAEVEELHTDRPAAVPVSDGSSRSSRKRRAVRSETRPLDVEKLGVALDAVDGGAGGGSAAAETMSTADSSFHTADAMEPSYASDDPTSGQITPVPIEEVFDFGPQPDDARVPSAAGMHEELEKPLPEREWSPVFFGGEEIDLMDDRVGDGALEMPAPTLDEQLSRYMFEEPAPAEQPASDLLQPPTGPISRRPLLLSPAVSQQSDGSDRGWSFDEEPSPEAYESHLAAQASWPSCTPW